MKTATGEATKQMELAAVEAAPLARIDPAAESMRLVAAATEKNLDVDKLERLIAMRDADLQRRAVQSFHDSMSEFHRLCPTIRRTRTAKITTRSGSQYSYQYADLDAIQYTVDPILRSLGLRYTWDTGVDDTLMTTTCLLSHVDGHEVPSSFSCPTQSDAGMSAAQKFGSATTYGKRQSLVAVLGLAMGDPDVDGAELANGESSTISEEQARDLSELIESVNGNKARFLTIFGIADLGDLPANRYDEAVAKCKSKAAKK